MTHDELFQAARAEANRRAFDMEPGTERHIPPMFLIDGTNVALSYHLRKVGLEHTDLLNNWRKP